MNNHLPECPMAFDDYWNYEPAECCCKQLRACERRMEASNQGFADMASFELGRRAGVQAAREAVARLLPSPGDAPLIDLRDALAAIDALRGQNE